MAEACSSNKCLKKLQAEWVKERTRSVPTQPELADLWKKVISAYWTWMRARQQYQWRYLRVKKLELQIKTRLVAIQRQRTRNKINKIQKGLGYRFALGQKRIRTLAPDPGLSATKTSAGP